MLVYRMTLVTLRLLHKNLGSLQDLLGKWFTPFLCISTYLDCDLLEHYSANAQNTYRRIYKSY